MSTIRTTPAEINPSSDFEDVKKTLSRLNAPIIKNSRSFDGARDSFTNRFRNQFDEVDKQLAQPDERSELLGIVIAVEEEFDQDAKKNVTKIYVDVPQKEFDFIDHPDSIGADKSKLQLLKHKVFYAQSEVLLEREKPGVNDIVRVSLASNFMSADEINPYDNKYLGIYSRSKNILPNIAIPSVVSTIIDSGLGLVNGLFGNNEKSLATPEEKLKSAQSQLFFLIKKLLPELSNTQIAALVASFDLSFITKSLQINQEKLKVLDNKDLAKISEMSDRFKPIVVDILHGLREAKITYFLGDAFRTVEESNAKYAAYLAGGPLAAPGGQSAHNFKEALDINLTKDNKFIENINAPEWQRLGALARQFGAIWGGSWEPKKIDGPHIEHPKWRETKQGIAALTEAGIIGWNDSVPYTGKRLTNLKKFSSNQGVDPLLVGTQINFLVKELQSTTWEGTNNLNRSLEELKRQTTIDGSSYVLKRLFGVNSKKEDQKIIEEATKLLADVEEKEKISTEEAAKTPVAESPASTPPATTTGSSASKPTNRPKLFLKKFSTDLASSTTLSSKRGDQYILVREDIFEDLIKIKEIFNNFSIPFSCNFIDVNLRNPNISQMAKLGLEIRLNKNLALSRENLLIGKNEFYVGPDYSKPFGNGYRFKVYAVTKKLLNKTNIPYEFKTEIVDLYSIKDTFLKEKPKIEKNLISYLDVTKIFQDYGFKQAEPRQEFFLNSNFESSNWNVFYKPSKIIDGISYKECLQTIYDLTNEPILNSKEAFWDGKRFK